jgi:hypothetical protein
MGEFSGFNCQVREDACDGRLGTPRVSGYALLPLAGRPATPGVGVVAFEGGLRLACGGLNSEPHLIPVSA